MQMNAKEFSLVFKLFVYSIKNSYMTVVIKRSADIESILQIIGSLSQPSKFNAHQFCGILKLNRSPLDIQNKMRDEWE